MGGTRLKVLLIEDNPGDARLIREMLAEFNPDSLTLVWQTRLADGLGYLAETGADLVLLDLSLPDSQGFVTFERLHDHAPTVPIVVLTGLDDEEIGFRTVQAGAQDYLYKGRVDDHLLVRSIRYAIERKRTEESQRFLAEASRVLAGSLDYRATLNQVARLAVPFLADRVIIDVVEGDHLDRVAVACADPERDVLADALRRSTPHMSRSRILTRAILEGKSAIYSRVDADFIEQNISIPELRRVVERLGAVSYLVVPLRTRERTLGALVFVSAESKREYTAVDLVLAEELARRCALAVDNARLYEAERRARAEAESLAAERSAMLGQIADGVVIADPSGRITFINQAARHLLGLSGLPGEIPIEMLLPAFAGSDGRPRSIDDLPLVRTARFGETIVDAEWRIQHPNGRDVIVIGSATPVVADDGSRLGAVLAFHDVTAQRNLERQKEEFFASVSHDLRTPLGAIKTSISVVLSNEPPGTSPPLHRLFVNIDQSADRIEKLVTDLLELARLEAGRVELRWEDVDFRRLAERTISTIEPLAATRQQQLTLTLPDSPVIVRVDAHRIERAILNLLANAHKYGRQGGSIGLRLEPRDGAAVLLVSDDGPGIPEAEQAHVFERFYRRDTELTRRTPGSGLGLPIARAMVELLGGRIGVQSTPETGTTFWIALPLPTPTVPPFSGLPGRRGLPTPE